MTPLGPEHGGLFYPREKLVCGARDCTLSPKLSSDVSQAILSYVYLADIEFLLDVGPVSFGIYFLGTLALCTVRDPRCRQNP